MEKVNTCVFLRRRIKTEREKGEIFGEGKHLWKRRKIFEKKENIFLQRKRNNRGRKGYLEKEIIFFGGEGKYLEKKIYLLQRRRKTEGKMRKTL